MIETVSFSVVVEVCRDFSEVTLVSVGFVGVLDSDVAIVTVNCEGTSGTAVSVLIE